MRSQNGMWIALLVVCVLWSSHDVLSGLLLTLALAAVMVVLSLLATLAVRMLLPCGPARHALLRLRGGHR